jgi:SAM-dependent methyltransferase
MVTSPLANLRRLFRGGVRHPDASPAHCVAHRYWQACSDTFIADPDYYARCASALRDDILPRLGTPHRALDLGCGNGRYTLLLAQVAHSVDACDLSSALIAQARRSMREHAVKNVRFRVEDITVEQPRVCAYDLVSCMGVLSTVIDDWAFYSVTRSLRSALGPGGVLLLRDSVSHLPDGQVIESDSYATRYRNEDAYRREFAALGMALEHEVLLAEFGSCLNKFYLYRLARERFEDR